MIDSYTQRTMLAALPEGYTVHLLRDYPIVLLATADKGDMPALVWVKGEWKEL